MRYPHGRWAAHLASLYRWLHPLSTTPACVSGSHRADGDDGIDDGIESPVSAVRICVAGGAIGHVIGTLCAGDIARR